MYGCVVLEMWPRTNKLVRVTSERPENYSQTHLDFQQNQERGQQTWPDIYFSSHSKQRSHSNSKVSKTANRKSFI